MREPAARVPADVLEDEVAPPRDRRAARAAARPARSGSVMVLSTIDRCTSGRIDVITWPRIATPKAISTPFLWRTRNGQSFRSQPGSDGCLHCSAATPAPADPSCRRRVRARSPRAASAAGELRRARRSTTDGSRTSARNASSRSRIARSATRSAARPAGVIVSRIARRSPSTDGALHEPVGDERLDRGRDGGPGERQLPGEAARPLLAARRSAPGAGTGGG